MAMRVTHGFSFATQTAAVIFGFYFYLILPAQLMGYAGYDTRKNGLMWLMLIILFGWAYSRLWDFVVPSLSTFLYVRVTLDTQITWSEAKQLRPLFDDYLGRGWDPSKEVLDINKSDRKDHLFAKLSAAKGSSE
jgi:hypothetical protein